MKIIHHLAPLRSLLPDYRNTAHSSTMPTLEAPGASLRYEVAGTGPFLLLIPGADGRGTVFSTVVERLSNNFTVITWDRRGYSRSLLQGRQDFSKRLETDADDAHCLIQHVAQGPAAVLGTSSGAIVAMNLLLRHPQSVSRLIAHEPPSLAVLPADIRSAAEGIIGSVYSTYRAHGSAAAMEAFTGGLSGSKDAPLMKAAMDGSQSDEIRANSMFWFEFELWQYTSSPLDIEGLKAQAEKLVPAVGRDSPDGPGLGPIKVISHAIGKEVQVVAGAHLGYVTDPKEWAQSVTELLGVSQL